MERQILEVTEIMEKVNKQELEKLRSQADDLHRLWRLAIDALISAGDRENEAFNQWKQADKLYWEAFNAHTR